MHAPADEIIHYAAGLIHKRVRLDTSEIATRFGMSRTTLFRRVGNREKLMGEAVWWLASRALRRAETHWLEQYGTAVRDEKGWLRYLRILEHYGNAAVREPGLAWLLENEQPVAMRALTDPDGSVEPRLIAAHLTLLRRDVAEGGLVPLVDLETLAFAVVRMGDAIFYSDVMAGHTEHFPKAMILIQQLVEGVLQVPRQE
ncbi:QsdR family transcriptional regulator [Nocardia salmonicida]|uniref:QsdR family transcriptional regulator n=1 Tax=Nocardia salmonicida TaxID=53431 RepID=UPI002E2A06C7|nr:QsdR family transcriptional regulator [Nocardia salmonicida]